MMPAWASAAGAWHARVLDAGRHVHGQPDPRDEGKFVPERPPHVLTVLAFSADARYGFVGWSLRAHPA